MTTRPVLPLALVLSALAAMPALAQHGHDGGNDTPSAPYTGLDQREIPTLSQDDIAELRAGGGWGMALPAELQGHPGPAHLLELADEIALSATQTAEIEQLHDRMRSEAIAAGERLIAAEAALGAAFADGLPERDRLRELVDAAAATRAELRFIHLSSHLATPRLLGREQIARYNRLRGYGDDASEDHDAGSARHGHGGE